MGVPESFALWGACSRSSGSLERVLPRRDRGRGGGLGGARASEAGRLGARAREGRPRAAAFPPTAAPPLLAAAGARGARAPSRAAAATGARHMPSAAPRLVRAEGRPQASSPSRAALRNPPPPRPKVLASGAVSRRGRLPVAGGTTRPGCQWRSESALERPGRDSAGALAIGTRPQLCFAGRAPGSWGWWWSGTSEPGGAGWGGFRRDPGAEGCLSRVRSAEPFATSRGGGGCSCAGDGVGGAGVRAPAPPTLGRAPGSRWDHLFPVPAGSAERAVPAAPPPLQLASSPRPLQTGRRRRRLSRRRRRACAPTRAHTPPGRPRRRGRRSSGFHGGSARGPASRRATPSGHAHCARPAVRRRRGAAAGPIGLATRDGECAGA